MFLIVDDVTKSLEINAHGNVVNHVSILCIFKESMWGLMLYCRAFFLLHI